VTYLMACRGCGLLVSPGPRCSACRKAWRAEYDRARPLHHAVYRTADWRRLSAEVRAGARRCHWCLKPTTWLVADHVIPLDQRPDLALDPENLVAACFACNTRRGRNSQLPDLPIPEPARRARAHPLLGALGPSETRTAAVRRAGIPTRSEEV
jgi:5-methylcytosine-specific restriction endonuclease McrA